MAEEGRHHGGGRRPFGYGGAPLLDAHGNPVLRSDGTPMFDHRVQRDDEAKLIREAARRVLHGESTWSILRDWTARGIQTSTGAPWNNRSLNQLLTSARVAGKRSHHGVITSESAEWQAILDEETWLGVRAVLAGRCEPAGRRPTYLLSGLVLCPCGSKMRSQAIRGRRRYTCVSGPSGGCGKCSRDAERLEAFVTRLVLLLASSGATPASVRGPAETPPEVAALEARLARLAEEYTDEMWTREEYLHLRGRLESKLAAAQEHPAAAQGFTAGGACMPSLKDWWRDTPDEQRRAIVRDFVRGVVVHPVGRGYRGDTTFENTDVLLTERGDWAMALVEQAAEHDALENAS
jgi:site-specific DNA recombinase